MMMRKTIQLTVILSAIVASLSGCAFKPAVKPYEANPYVMVPTKSLTWNFYQEGDSYIYYCDLVAQTGYQNKNPEKPEIEAHYNNNLQRCISDAEVAMDNRFSQLTTEKNSDEVKTLVVTYYNAWKPYIAALDIDKQPDSSIVAMYSKALNDLSLQVKN